MTDTAPTSKACTKCGVVKLLGEFYREKLGAYGLKSLCKACKKVQYAQWCASNLEKSRTTHAKWCEANHEKVKAQKTKWYAANLEKSRVSNSEWRAANPEKVKAKRSKNITELEANYVAKLIGIPVSKVPPEILALKREAIAMKRISKQIKHIINPKKAAP